MSNFDFTSTCKLDIDSISSWPTKCYQLLFSKALSAGILLGSFVVKLPQVINLVSSKTAEGLSPEAIYSEVPLSLFSCLYSYRLGYPFTSYGESATISVQNVFLVYLLWTYMKPKPTLTVKLQVFAMVIASGLIAWYIPAEYLYVLPSTCMVLMVFSRVSQIINNFKQGTTGQLSSITTGLTFAGSLARVYTTVSEVGFDLSLIASFGVGALLSGILLAQVQIQSLLVYHKIIRLFALSLIADCVLFGERW